MNAYLIDENLPYQLGIALGIDYVHATRIAEQASDSQLWSKARTNNWTILTRDADFFDRMLAVGPPPKVIWIRVGNMRKSDLIELMCERWKRIQAVSQTHDMVQVHPDRIEAMDFPPST